MAILKTATKPSGRAWSLLAALVLICYGGQAQQPSRPYQVKAVFLFNFAEFTEWPADAFENTNAPLVIGILGSDPFDGFLDDTVRNETVRGRELVVKRFRRVEEIETCHILYIGESESPRLEHDLAVLKGKPVLTVSDVENAALRGVMIRFLTDRKIHLRINLGAVRAGNLNISSKLLRAAEIVGVANK
jgi:hypothetical protein